jgi:hypothetical protein
MTPISEVPKGTPIELDPADWWPGSDLALKSPDPYLCLMDVWIHYTLGTGYPQVNTFQPYLQSRVIYGKDYRENRYGMYEISSFHPVKVLTGPEGEKLLELWADYEERNKSLPNYTGYSGTDPEIFVSAPNPVTGILENLPAWKFLPPKEEAVKEEMGQCTAYWDGFQAEFTIEAGACMGYGSDRVQKGLGLVYRHARRHNPLATLSPETVIEVPVEILEGEEDAHVALGCSPSLNAYGESPLEVKDPRSLKWRFSGGHLHFGMGESWKNNAPAIVQAIDTVCALPFVGIAADVDSPIRRKYYGRAGEYRLPEHGIEYRTLSSAWLYHPALWNLAIDLGRKGGGVGSQEGLLKELFPGLDQQEVRRIINSCDVEGAREFVREHQKGFARILSRTYGESRYAACLHTFNRLVQEGMLAVCAGARGERTSIEDNWWLSPGAPTWVGHCNGYALNFSNFSKEIHAGTYKPWMSQAKLKKKVTQPPPPLEKEVSTKPKRKSPSKAASATA